MSTTAAASPMRHLAQWRLYFRGGRLYLWLALLALSFSAVSLTYPSTPSYDPWSWLIWGREIFHALTGSGPSVDTALHIAGGSSWKPLPVIFTTVFALFGSAQPNLWLLVARAGAGLTVLVAAKITVRMTLGLVEQTGSQSRLSARALSDRAVAVAPAVFAGAAVLVVTTFTPHYAGNMMLGYSEGVMTAAFLIAVERAWDGHHRQAFALGLIPCLDRPEVWPLWGIYGLWLMWRDRGARLLVLGLGVLMLALWGVPQKLGGGSLIGLGTHAMHNHQAGSCANASFPFSCELSNTLWPLVLERLELATLALIVFTAYLLIRARRQLGSWEAAVRRHAAATAAAASGLFGMLWWLGIAVETQIGFAGNPRYAVIGVMLICISGCAAYGWACVGVATITLRGLRRLAARVRPLQGVSRAAGWTPVLAVATLVMLFVFALVPNRFTNQMPTVSSIRSELSYQAQLRERFAALIQSGGGVDRVLSCGTSGAESRPNVLTNNLQVTMLAWYLKVPIYYVSALPPREDETGPGPNVVFQDPATQGAIDYPLTSQMHAWNLGWMHANGTQYRIFNAPPVTLYMNCSVANKKP